MKRVFICSPYRGDVAKNIGYAKAATHDCIDRGEAPFTPHLLYPQVLNDQLESDRKLGMEFGMTFLLRCNLVAVYEDNGISEGMRREIKHAMDYGVAVEYRKLGD